MTPTFDLVGHSYAVSNLAPEPGAAQLLASHLGATLNNKAMAGAVLTADDQSGYPGSGGGYATIANQLPRTNGSPYARCTDYGIVWFGINDIAGMDSIWSSTAQENFRSTLRFGISRMCAAKVFDDTDKSIAYKNFSENGPAESLKDLVTGEQNHVSSTKGATVTISVPSDFPGGTVAVYFGSYHGEGGIVTFKVDGTSSGEINTRITYELSDHISATMFCMRFTGLAAGAHTIVCTLGTTTGNILFDSWAIEAPVPPTVIVPGQFTLSAKGYGFYTEGGAAHTPTSANVEKLESIQKAVCEEFGSYAVFVSLASMNGTTKVQSDGLHPNAEGHQQIYELMAAALPAEAVARHSLTLLGVGS